MTTLTPILYADGALRLTDHGPRGGGLVLVLEEGSSTRQLDLPYNAPGAGAQVASMIGREIEAMERCNYEPEVIFEQLVCCSSGRSYASLILDGAALDGMIVAA